MVSFGTCSQRILLLEVFINDRPRFFLECEFGGGGDNQLFG